MEVQTECCRRNFIYTVEIVCQRIVICTGCHDRKPVSVQMQTVSTKVSVIDNETLSYRLFRLCCSSGDRRTSKTSLVREYTSCDTLLHSDQHRTESSACQRSCSECALSTISLRLPELF